MDIFEALQGRKSIRRFKESPVPDSDVRRILDAGRVAPSAHNTQPWSFLVIKNRAVIKKMGDGVRMMVDKMLPFAESEKQVQRLTAYKNTYYTFFERAPLLIAVFLEAHEGETEKLLARMKYSREEIDRLRPLQGLQSVSAAIQNMLLAIHALGYGSCWMTGPLIAQEEFEKILGYGKERFIAALLPVGIPDEKPATLTKKPLEAIMKIIP